MVVAYKEQDTGFRLAAGSGGPVDIGEDSQPRGQSGSKN